MKRSNKLTRSALLLATLLFAGCGTLMPGLTSGANQQSPPVNSRGAVQAFPPLQYNNYCEAQRAIAEANSRRDTLKTGKKVVYKAPCDLDAPKPADKPKPPEPTTTGGWRPYVRAEPKAI